MIIFFKRLSVFITLFVLQVYIAYSQQSTDSRIQIEIVDRLTEEPVNHAVLDLRDIQSKQELQSEVTSEDTDNIYRLETNESGTVELVISHPDYVKTIRVLDLDNPKIEKIELEPLETISLQGRVVDAHTGETIPFATIEVISSKQRVELGSQIVTITDNEGQFEFNFQFMTPYKLRISHISYLGKEVELHEREIYDYEVNLLSRTVEGEEIVVFSSLVEEERMRETVTIDQINATQIQQVASFDAFDLVSTLRDVDIATQSMNLQTVSTRGFNTGANSRFLQLTDGVDNQVPGLGFPVGNLMGPVELDISTIDLLVGPSSSRYGSNAMTGVLHTKSKDPFRETGLSFNVKSGVHGLKLSGSDFWSAEGEGMYDLSLRFAQSFKNKVAFKFSGSLIAGTDWQANNYENAGWGGPFENYDSDPPNPGYDGINVYGDENFVYLPVGSSENVGDGNLIPVTRTGYKENELVDYDLATRKLHGSLHFKITPSTEIIFDGRYGYTNTLYTADSRIRLEDFEVYQMKAELIAPAYYLRGYTTWQNSGNTYDVVQLATNLLREAKSDEDWYRDFRIIYEQGWPILNIPPGDLDRARDFADSGSTLAHGREASARYEPGTDEFKEKLNALKSSYGYEGGAGVLDNSRLYHLESGYSNEIMSDMIDMDLGGEARFYELDSAGTVFPDTASNELSNYEFGGYATFKTSFLEESLNLNSTVRLDKNENFPLRFSPQFGVGLILNDSHYFRFSYQYGFRFPSVREQFLSQEIGDTRILGGLEEIYSRYDFHNNSVTVQALAEYNEQVTHDINNESFNRNQAEIRNLSTLEKGIIGAENLKPIKAESTHALEAGYRNSFTPNFYIDLNSYVNFYRDFIGLMRIVKPRVSPSVDLYTASGQLNNSTESDQFYVYTNASEWISIYGISFDLKYQSGNFFSGLNGNYTRLIKDGDDPIMPGFNTPPFKLNFEWGNRRIAENVGFRMNFRLRTKHYWQSPFLNGWIDTYGHFDFQFNIRIPQINSMIKTGFTNMGINDYYNVFGGPKVGSIVFATFTFNPSLF